MVLQFFWFFVLCENFRLLVCKLQEDVKERPVREKVAWVRFQLLFHHGESVIGIFFHRFNQARHDSADLYVGDDSQHAMLLLLLK